MGMFSLSAVEPIRAVIFDLKTVSDAIFDVSEDYVTQHSADEEASSPFRMYRSAAFSLGCPSNMVNAFIRPSFTTGGRTPRVYFNNAIPLKLRI
jgi:hypothetical protein